MTQHTPTPWLYRLSFNNPLPETDHAVIYNSSDLSAKPVIKIYGEGHEANAAFIVRACNSHDALVEAMENLLNANPAFRSMPVGSPGSLARIAQEMAIEAEDAEKAALALAKVSQ